MSAIDAPAPGIRLDHLFFGLQPEHLARAAALVARARGLPQCEALLLLAEERQHTANAVVCGTRMPAGTARYVLTAVASAVAGDFSGCAWALDDASADMEREAADRWARARERVHRKYWGGVRYWTNDEMMRAIERLVREDDAVQYGPVVAPLTAEDFDRIMADLAAEVAAAAGDGR